MDQQFIPEEILENNFDETMPTAAPGMIRLANHLLDSVLLAMVLSLFVSIFMPEMLPKSLEELVSGSFFNFLYPLQFLYYLVMEYFFGKTVAKLLTKTYVTTEFNEKPDFKAILIRTLCRCIPFEYVTFLRNGIGWHDKFSKTYVVRNPE